jgi:opacity protein-like surface antigen
VTQGLAYAKSSSDWNLAWAVHAGLGYQVTPNLTLELAYRYLNLGDADTGTIYNYAGRCSRCEPITFKELDSHDVKIGMRWVLAPPPPAFPQAPVTTKY